MRYARSLTRLVEQRCGRHAEIGGVEVGVYRGELSAHLLRHFGRLTLWLVDPWRTYGPQDRYYRTEDPKSRLNAADQEANFRATCERIEPYRERVWLLRQDSVRAAARLAKSRRRLAFVFLDADHSYEGVSEDIAAWWPLVASGGLLTGHDYGFGGYQFGVKPAVDDWAKANGLTVLTAPGTVWAVCKE